MGRAPTLPVAWLVPLGVAAAPLPAAAFQLFFDMNVGETRSGVTRSECTGAIDFFQEDPFSFTEPGHQPTQVLSRSVVRETDTDCPSGAQYVCTSETIQNGSLVHYDVGFGGTTGFWNQLGVSALKTTSGLGYRPDAIHAEMRGDDGGFWSGDLYRVNDDDTTLWYRFLTGVPLPGSAQIDVALTQDLDVDLSSSTAPSDCPGAPPRVVETGSSQTVFDGVTVAVAGYEGDPPGLVVHPASAMLDPDGSQSFAAYRCSSFDVDGRPDVGSDGMPGTSDDTCGTATVTWFPTGGIGDVSPSTGTTTTLTTAPGESRGQVVAQGTDDVGAADVTVGDGLPPRGTMYFSTTRSRPVPGVAPPYDDADVYAFDGTDFFRTFDAQGAGLPRNADVDSIAIWPGSNGGVQLVFLGFRRGRTQVPGISEPVGDEDIVQYDVAGGTFSLYFDGSDAGLEKGREDVDAFSVLGPNEVVVSTVGNASVPGASARDEDLLHCQHDGTIPIRSCTWSLYFDGSDVALDRRRGDVAGASVGTSGALSLVPTGPFDVGGGRAGRGRDLIECFEPTIGETTVCSGLSLFFDGSDAGLRDKIDAIDLP